MTDHLDQTSDTPSNLRLRECVRRGQRCDTGRDGAIVPHYLDDTGRECVAATGILRAIAEAAVAGIRPATYDYTAHRLRAFSRSSD